MKTKTYQWAILTLIMVLIALYFGLRPKAWPIDNDVQWLSDKGAIRFQTSGIAYVDDLRVLRRRRQSRPLTIEMVVSPAGIDKSGFSPLLVMHDGADRRQLAIWQYGASLIVMNGNDYDYRQRRPRVVGKNIFSPQRTRYLTITSGEQGTRLYVDGILSAANSNWKLSIPAEGTPLRLVLGHSVYGRYGWRGDIHGLALAGEAISAESVRLRFERWSADRRFDVLKQDSTILLFSFDHQKNSRIEDRSGNENNLNIPAHMTVLQKTFLAFTWRSFDWNRAAVGDMVVNVVGFMPLGILCYGFLQCFSKPFSGHRHLLAVVLCMMFSLGIEIAQAWIPTRHSSLSDWVLNTFGAWLGIVGWRLIHSAEATRMDSD